MARMPAFYAPKSSALKRTPGGYLTMGKPRFLGYGIYRKPGSEFKPMSETTRGDYFDDPFSAFRRNMELALEKGQITREKDFVRHGGWWEIKRIGDRGYGKKKLGPPGPDLQRNQGYRSFLGKGEYTEFQAGEKINPFVITQEGGTQALRGFRTSAKPFPSPY